jgi:hypothetical protein
VMIEFNCQQIDASTMHAETESVRSSSDQYCRRSALIGCGGYAPMSTFLFGWER